MKNVGVEFCVGYFEDDFIVTYFSCSLGEVGIRVLEIDYWL